MVAEPAEEQNGIGTAADGQVQEETVAAAPNRSARHAFSSTALDATNATQVTAASAHATGCQGTFAPCVAETTHSSNAPRGEEHRPKAAAGRQRAPASRARRQAHMPTAAAADVAASEPYGERLELGNSLRNGTP